MAWQLFVGLSVFSYAISVIVQRSILKKDTSDPVAYSIVFGLLTGICIGIYAFIHGFHMPDIQTYWKNIILMLALFATGDVLIFKSLKIIEASSFTILFSTRGIWSIIAALLFLGEQFSILKTIGALAIVLGVILVSIRSKKFSIGRGEILALVAAFCFGLGFINDAFIIRHTDIASYLTIAFILQSLVIWAVFPKSFFSRKDHTSSYLFNRKTLCILFSISAMYAFSTIAEFIAYTIGNNASQISPLLQTSTILTVLFGIIFLGERTSLTQKICGTLLSFIGIILLR